MLKLTQLQSSYDTGVLITQHALFHIQCMLGLKDTCVIVTWFMEVLCISFQMLDIL